MEYGPPLNMGSTFHRILISTHGIWTPLHSYPNVAAYYPNYPKNVIFFFFLGGGGGPYSTIEYGPGSIEKLLYEVFWKTGRHLFLQCFKFGKAMYIIRNKIRVICCKIRVGMGGSIFPRGVHI